MNSLNKTLNVERIKEVEGRLQWVAEQVSPMIDEDFAVDEDRLDYEMARLGHLLAYYGTLFGELKSELIRKEENLKRSYSIQAQAIRVKARGDGEKITDATVRERVESDDRYGTQQSALQMTRLYGIMSEAWFQAIKKKADLVIALAYKQGREIKSYDQGGG